ncbi:MAG TPA: DUF1287 domain-containing protein [Kofleriaceae bacterium]|nr:DUF1287 domain-containing protein [Kofleriaceae bacterium]
MIFIGCSSRSDAEPAPRAPPAPERPPRPATPAAPAAPARATPETSLGVADRGIWPDLDPKIQLALPAGLTAEHVRARVDDRHHMLILSIDGVARKVYPLGGAARLTVGAHVLALRPGDRDELADLVRPETLTSGPAVHDRDDDGIPDALDLLIGARKTLANADAYTREAEDYISLSYPMGDVPRTIGVCTDVIIRAVRNAGIDIQKELHEDIRRARAAYPMVKGAGDPSIDQRRVGTLLPYFKRRWEAHTARLDDPADPLRPGDILLMDTFPSRSGPDHIGILSDRLDDQGLPLVINNWTDGTVTAEMDLLVFVPVMYRFRLPQ